jgi:hypothetical protein
MTGIQFTTDAKGRKTAVVIDLRKHRAPWEDIEDGLISESRRKERSVPYEEYRASRLEAQSPTCLNTLSKSSSRRQRQFR